MKNRTNLRTLVALERERERERESYTLVKYGAKEEVESTRRVVILPRDCE